MLVLNKNASPNNGLVMGKMIVEMVWMKVKLFVVSSVMMIILKCPKLSRDVLVYQEKTVGSGNGMEPVKWLHLSEDESLCF